MRTRGWIVLLSVWPGLAQIWTGQEVVGLILAAVFALSLNAAILSRFIWVDLLAQGWPTYCALLAGATWILTLMYTAWWLLRRHPERYRVEIDRLYRASLDAYLQGKWNEARRACEQILSHDEQDAEALLQIGLIFARIGKPEPARLALLQCLETEGGVKWRWEIEAALGRVNASN